MYSREQLKLVDPVKMKAHINRVNNRSSMKNLTDDQDAKLANLAYENLGFISIANSGIDPLNDKPLPKGERFPFIDISVENIDGVNIQIFAKGDSVTFVEDGQTVTDKILLFAATNRSGESTYFKTKVQGMLMKRAGVSAKLAATNKIKSLSSLTVIKEAPTESKPENK